MADLLTLSKTDASIALLSLTRFLLFWQFHDKAVQFFGQTLLVVVGLFGGHVDGSQHGATLKSFFADFLDTEPKVTHSNAVHPQKVLSINLTGPNTDALVRPVQL